MAAEPGWLSVLTPFVRTGEPAGALLAPSEAMCERGGIVAAEPDRDPLNGLRTPGVGAAPEEGGRCPAPLTPADTWAFWRSRALWSTMTPGVPLLSGVARAD